MTGDVLRALIARFAAPAASLVGGEKGATVLMANLEQIDDAARRVVTSTDDVAPDALRRLRAGDAAYGDRRVASAWTTFSETWAAGLDVLVGGAGSVGQRLAETSAAYRAVDEQASDRLTGLQPW